MTREKEEKRRKEEKISPYLYRSGLVMECAALCHGSAREKKRNARKEKDRAAEIWRRIEKMGKDERGCGILPFGECKKLPENNYWLTSARKPLGTKGFRVLCALNKNAFQRFFNTQRKKRKTE